MPVAMPCARYLVAGLALLGAAAFGALHFPAGGGEALNAGSISGLPLSAPLPPGDGTGRDLPTDLSGAVALARHYMVLGRSQGEDSYYADAQTALAPWWDQQEMPAEVLLLRAVFRQHRHQFGPALADLQRVLQREPDNAQAWLTRAVVLQVRGEYVQALASCLPLWRLASTLVATTCISSVASRKGRAQESYTALHQALADSSRENAAERLWSLAVLAEIAARLGWSAQADTHFRQALAFDPGDHHTLSAYADFLLGQQRAPEVLALLDREHLSDALLLRHTLAKRQLAAADYHRQAAELMARIEEHQHHGGQAHWDLEAQVALHILGEPSRALALALRNWEVQQEPRDARLVLETALAAGQPQPAAPVLSWVEDRGLEDLRIAALRRRLRELPF